MTPRTAGPSSASPWSLWPVFSVSRVRAACVALLLVSCQQSEIQSFSSVEYGGKHTREYLVSVIRAEEADACYPQTCWLRSDRQARVISLRWLIARERRRGDGGGITIIRGVDLPSLEFSHSNLAEIDLHQLDLGGVFLASDFKGADIHRSLFRHSSLSGSDFSRANLDEADFSHANLSSAIMVDVSAVKALFYHTEFEETSFMGANLEEAAFSHASFEYVDFSNAHMSDADFAGAILFGVNFQNADLSGSNFQGATCTAVHWGDATCPSGSLADPEHGCRECRTKQ